MGEQLRDRIVLLLTNGMTAEAAEGYCIRQGRLNADAAQRLRKRVQLGSL
jgi:hypothetical protein